MKYQKKRNWNYKVYEDVFYKLEYSYPLIEHEYFKIHNHGMWIYKGYTWDGATGIPDTDKTISVSLPHDAFYQSFREGYLPREYKKKVDEELEIMYKERSSWFTSWFGNVIYLGVRVFGSSSTKCDIYEVE